MPLTALRAASPGEGKSTCLTLSACHGIAVRRHVSVWQSLPFYCAAVRLHALLCRIFEFGLVRGPNGIHTFITMQLLGEGLCCACVFGQGAE